MKSTTVFFKDLKNKYGAASHRTDIYTIAIDQNIFYSMAASEAVEIFIQENIQQENLHLEAATQS